VTTLLAAVTQAAVWLSPAALFGLGPLLLGDGTRGLIAPVALAAGATLVARLLAGPWPRGAAGGPLTLLDLVAYRWPGASRALAPLALADAGAGLLFLWAQLAAVRELAQGAGWAWPRPAIAVVAVAALVALATWRRGLAGALGPLGAAVALVGLAVPLGAVLAVTTPLWPRVWTEVVARPAIRFAAGSPWTRDGRPVRGPEPAATVRPADDQPVRVLAPARVRLDPWEGGGGWREVAAGAELGLRPGDRLTVPADVRLRFEPGRRIPGAPASGADWITPSAGGLDGRALGGLAVTLALGALGLPAAHVGVARGSVRASRLAAGLVTAGAGLAALWALYTLWLAPEVYAGGVGGLEPYELPALVPALGGLGGPLRDLALVGLVGGAVATSLATLHAAPTTLVSGAGPGGARRALPLPALGATALACLLATLTPAGGWAVLLAAFGLAASAGAPGAVLAMWSERARARAVAAGAGAGLALYAGLSAWPLLDPRAGAGISWLAWLSAYPAVIAAPIGLAVAWLAASGQPRRARHGPLPPDLAQLHR
jgi:hypothetical protein